MSNLPNSRGILGIICTLNCPRKKNNGQVWWHIPVGSATWEAEVGEWLVLDLTEFMTCLDSSETHLKNKINNNASVSSCIFFPLKCFY
jgi:hypothetical protein